MIARPRTFLSLPPPLRLLVALIVLTAGIASGSTVVAAETGVAANPAEITVAVEADIDIGPAHVGSNTLVFDDWTSGCCVAPQTPLYRAVTDAEVSDLRAVDRFRAGPGYEGKLFATSPADAARFGQLNYGLKGGEPFHIVETRVSSSTFESLYRDRMDGMPAVFVDASQFDTLAAPSIWDSVPWTPKGGN